MAPSCQFIRSRLTARLMARLGGASRFALTRRSRYRMSARQVWVDPKRCGLPHLVQVLVAAGWHVIAASAAQSEIDTWVTVAKVETRLLDVSSDRLIAALFDGLDSLHGCAKCVGVPRRGGEYDLTVFHRLIKVKLTGTMRRRLWPTHCGTGRGVPSSTSPRFAVHLVAPLCRSIPRSRVRWRK